MIVPMSELKRYLSANAMDKNGDNCGKQMPADSQARQQHFSDESVRQLMSSLIDSYQSRSPRKTPVKRDKLTRREQQILTLIMAGLSNKRIGQQLDICEGTVKVHVKNLMRKLKVRSRYEAALVSLADVLDVSGEN